MNIVRANKVCEAVKWLREHSQLYKEEGIIVEDQWIMGMRGILNACPEIY
jgi:hypothetical protein